MKPACKRDDCNRPRHAHGLCNAHYIERRRELAAIPTPQVVAPWREQAACSGADVDIFFDPERAVEALQFCRRCDVRDQCLEWALERSEEHGVLGGLTERQRARMARGRGLLWSRDEDLSTDRKLTCKRIDCDGTRVRDGLCAGHLQERHDARRRGQELSEVLDQANRIIGHVAERYGFKPYELTGRSRAGDVVATRNLAMAEVRDRLGLSYQAIGKLFDGRDHTSVIHGVRNAVREVAA